MREHLIALRSGILVLARWAGRAVAWAWGVVRPPLVGLLSVVAALVVLFEEWGWRPLAELLGHLARLRIFARLEGWIAGLPPYAALAVFVLPSAILFPVKVLGLWLLAKGQALLAGLVLAGAKVVSTALVARIFMLTRPALMRIGWFAWAYGKFMPWKEEIFARIRASWAWRYGRMVKTTVRHELRQAWQRWRPTVVARIGWSRAKSSEAFYRARLAGLRAWRDVRARLSRQ